MDFQCRREDQCASLGNKVHCPQGQSVGSWCLSHCRSDSTSARTVYQPHLSQKIVPRNFLLPKLTSLRVCFCSFYATDRKQRCTRRIRHLLRQLQIPFESRERQIRIGIRFWEALTFGGTESA
jgi:hypothetical protein